MFKFPFHRFWSQVLYDKNLENFVISYLRSNKNGWSFTELHKKPTELEALVNQKLLQYFYRCSQCKEDEDNYMEPSYHADIIYNNWVFDIPRIFDLIYLALCDSKHIENNHNQYILVCKTVSTIFQTQQLYCIDLDSYFELNPLTVIQT